MRVVFFHGMGGHPRGTTGAALAGQREGDETWDVHAPHLDMTWRRHDFMLREDPKLLCQCQKAIDEHEPDVVVGTSFGGRLALQCNLGPAALLLIAPAVQPKGPMGLALWLCHSGLEERGVSLPARGVSSVIRAHAHRHTQTRTVILHCPDDPVLHVSSSRALAELLGAELHEVAFDGTVLDRKPLSQAKHGLGFEAGSRRIVDAARILGRR